MKVSLTQGTAASVDVDLLIVPAMGPKFADHEVIKQLDSALSGELLRAAKLDDFKAKKGQVLVLHPFRQGSTIKAKKVRLMGLDEAQPDAAACRRFGHAAARAVKEGASVAVLDLFGEPALLTAVVEGLTLGAYRYATYLTGSRKPKPPGRVAIVTPKKPTAAQRAALSEGTIQAEAVNFARDLVNAPPNDLTATKLAAEARRVSREAGIRCTVWGRAEIEKRGMTLLAAVNAGSGEEPRFIHMSYVPRAGKKKLPKLVFVGKGLTFDAGGLSLKPAKSMETMKCDMAGGAATVAIVMAAAKLKLPVEVHGVVPATDNVVGSKSFKPGDVYRTLDGKTVEVLNTDAEGRLILADALTYARGLSPTVLIDHATLTGACMVALGHWRAALYATEDAVRERYLEAAKRSGEAYWPMPLDEEIRDTIKSPIADIKNTGDGYGGSIAAALFLREFVGDASWVHLDIAGPAFLASPHGLSPKGGTGFGVRTGIELIKSYA